MQFGRIFSLVFKLLCKGGLNELWLYDAGKPEKIQISINIYAMGGIRIEKNCYRYSTSHSGFFHGFGHFNRGIFNV